ncbi:hypothetical protein HMPREF0908_0796 [Selenomonas flueggei ATCC 43531]|uniref:Uncharacterized protein n=1 Tax=Selenomonas flueggei ATCC 43531 TaxID=638302 RepID=C4V2Q2_9FIRM|nr:hypothetical protein HMPREF0908_0796 [Selenomonas flueggei ATCC 43531]
MFLLLCTLSYKKMIRHIAHFSFSLITNEKWFTLEKHMCYNILKEGYG